MNPTYARYYTYIKPILRNPTVKTYSPIVFSILTITFFIIFAIKPTVATIISLQKTIDQQKQILKQLTDKESSLAAAKNSYQKLPDKVKEQLRNQIPSSTSLPCLITNLRTLASTSEASISGLQFQPTLLQGNSECPPKEDELKKLNKDATLEEVDITFNSTGNYPQLLNFLGSLQTSNRLINVQNVNFNKPEEGNLIMTVTAKAYYIKNQQAVSGGKK